MSDPRKHHYVPKCYLSGFTAEPDSPRLYVLDKEARKSYPSNIRDAGCERDFYIVEVEEEDDPFAVERFFGTLETHGAEALRHIIENGTLPEGDLYSKLIAFLAVMTVRGPAVIDSFEQPFIQIMKTKLWYATESPEAFEQFMAGADDEPKAKLEGVTYEQTRDFVRSDDIIISMSQNFKISSLLQMLETVEPLLAARTWHVVRAEEAAPEFICSDRPSTLCWTVPTLGPYSPGLGLANTTAMFPVSRQFALLGFLEEVQIPPHLNAKAVGVLNMYTAMYAKRFVYSGVDEFTVTLADGTFGTRDAFLAAVQAEDD